MHVMLVSQVFVLQGTSQYLLSSSEINIIGILIHKINLNRLFTHINSLVIEENLIILKTEWFSNKPDQDNIHLIFYFDLVPSSAHILVMISFQIYSNFITKMSSKNGDVDHKTLFCS